MDRNSIQSYYDESRVALKSASDSETLSRDLRSELESYLEDASKIIDSEGEPLLSYPSNFDSVVEQMNREDVTSEEEKPWTKYLFSENFEKTLEKNFGQRYANLFQEEANEKKISYGLAEIHMLDNQLMKVTKRAAALKANILQDNGFQEVFSPGTPGSEVATSDRVSEVSKPGNSSVMSKADMTFLTRLKGTSVADSNYDRAETPTTSRTAQSAITSPPTKGSSPAHSKMSGKDLTTLLYDALLQTDPNQDNESKAYSKSASGSTLMSNKKDKRDFMKENINLVKNAGRSRLSEDEQEKVRLIMGEDNDDKYMESLMESEFKYGLSNQERQAMEAIDQKLFTYGRMSRLGDSETLSRMQDSELGDSNTHNEFSVLTDQRDNKLRQVYNKKLDNLLLELTSSNVDLTTLVSNDDSGSKRFDMNGYNDSPSSLLDVPDISQVEGGRSVTVRDVLEMIKHAKKEPEKFKNDENSTSNLQLNAHDRNEIDKILSQYKGLVNQLGEMRKHARSSSNRGPASDMKDRHTWGDASNNDEYENDDDGDADENEDDSYSYNSASPYVLSETRRDVLEILDKEIKKKALLPSINSNNTMPVQLMKIFSRNDDKKVTI